MDNIKQIVKYFYNKYNIIKKYPFKFYVFNY